MKINVKVTTGEGFVFFDEKAQKILELLGPKYILEPQSNIAVTNPDTGKLERVIYGAHIVHIEVIQ